MSASPRVQNSQDTCPCDFPWRGSRAPGQIVNMQKAADMFPSSGAGQARMEGQGRRESRRMIKNTWRWLTMSSKVAKRPEVNYKS